MVYLLLSIICSVAVGVLFKTTRKFAARTTQIVMWNYVFTILLCYLFFSPQLLTELSQLNAGAPWVVYVPLMVLLPSIFLLLAQSIKHVGIVRTDAAQRLSLFIPILAAWFIFKEDFNTIKLAGLAVGFPAILLILYKKGTKEEGHDWLYPALVLFGFGTIDVLFKEIALTSTIGFATSLFVVFSGALVIMLIAVIYEVIFKQIKVSAINFAFGALVGIFNFGNIFFYLKAHQVFAENPSTVFASMNMGVIVLGSVAGIFIFKEKLSKLNYLGIILALCAIVIITISQIYVS